MCKEVHFAVILAFDEDVGKLTIVEVVGKLEWSSSMVLGTFLRRPSIVGPTSPDIVTSSGACTS
jgi:hypothetical protein